MKNEQQIKLKICQLNGSNIKKKVRKSKTYFTYISLTLPKGVVTQVLKQVSNLCCLQCSIYGVVFLLKNIWSIEFANIPGNSTDHEY